MPWAGGVYTHKWDWEREAPRATHVYNARLEDELNDLAGAITQLKTEIDGIVGVPGPEGPPGPAGPAGPAGPGLPAGGTTGQFPRKSSATDYDTAWHTLTKSDVGLANVDNTSDAAKPISTATQAALDLKQPLDAELTAIAGLASAADMVPYFTGSGTAALASLTAFGRTVIGSANAAALIGTLGLGTMALQNANAVAITGGTIASLSSFEAFSSGIFTKNQNATTEVQVNNADTTNASSRSQLLLAAGSVAARFVAIHGSAAFLGTTTAHPLLVQVNGLQALTLNTDQTIDAFGNINIAGSGNGVWFAGGGRIYDAVATGTFLHGEANLFRVYNEAGTTIQLEVSASSFTYLGNYVYRAGGTDVPITDGGTGASDAATARTNLGLVIGTNVQAQDAELAAIAGLTSAADKAPVFSGSGTAAAVDFKAGAWTAFTPTITTTTGSGLTAGTITGGYAKFGRLVCEWGQFTITALGTGAGLLQVSLSQTAAHEQFGDGRNVNTSAFLVGRTGGANAFWSTPAGAFPTLAVNNVIRYSIMYEATT